MHTLEHGKQDTKADGKGMSVAMGDGTRSQTGLEVILMFLVFSTLNDYTTTNFVFSNLLSSPRGLLENSSIYPKFD